MTPVDLQRIGEALYGLRWRAEMARGPDLAIRTVQSWERGEKLITDARAAQIMALAVSRLAGIRAAIDRGTCPAG